jgi:cytochrome c
MKLPFSLAMSLAAVLGSLSMASHAGDTAAVSGGELAKAKHCDVCHDARTPKVGPAFREVARRYDGVSNARNLLASVIRTGSGSPAAIYHWGSSPMPPDAVRIPVSEQEAGVLADYVLSLK